MQGEIAKRYDTLAVIRNFYLYRAFECSKLTIPSLIPDTADNLIDSNVNSTFMTPYQSVGANGVNNLASKLLLALLPPNMPFFRLRLDNMKLQQSAQNEEFQTAIEEALSKIEQLVMGDVASSTDRTVLFEGLKHLVVGGNVLFYCPIDNKNKMRAYPLKKYVVNRDPEGTVLEIIVKEQIAFNALSDSIKEVIAQKDKNFSLTNDDSNLVNNEKSVPVYTYVRLENNKYKISQEVEGEVIPESIGTYPVNGCPWIPVRFIRVDGESYGRGYVEEYYGDIASLEGLQESLMQGTAASSKLIFLVEPNGSTNVKDLAETANCGFASGRASDVSCLQPQKQADLQVAMMAIDKLEKRISYAFLLNTSIQRNGDRVTAEEVRLMAEDLETALGGIYSLLAEEFQLPYVNCKLIKLQKLGKMNKLPKDVVKPSIVTGMDALGRSSDKAKLTEFMQLARGIFGEQAIAQLIKPLNGLSRLASSLGLDKTGLVKTEEELQQEQQQAQQLATMQQLAPSAISAIKDVATKGLANNQQEQQGE